MKIEELIGDEKLLELKKTAFLCSRKVPASVILRCYDWASAQRDAGQCVISGFHSQIEKDVFHFLLKGKQPIILALARGMKKQLDPALLAPLEQGRLLIITPFSETVKRASNKTALERNQLMIELASQITIGFASPGGQLETLLKECTKPVEWI
jgi:hypothetical protein